MPTEFESSQSDEQKENALGFGSWFVSEGQVDRYGCV